MTECICRMQKCSHVQIHCVNVHVCQTRGEAVGKLFAQKSLHESLLFVQSTLNIRALEVRQTRCEQPAVATNIMMSAKAFNDVAGHDPPPDSRRPWRVPWSATDRAFRRADSEDCHPVRTMPPGSRRSIPTASGRRGSAGMDKMLLQMHPRPKMPKLLASQRCSDRYGAQCHSDVRRLGRDEEAH